MFYPKLILIWLIQRIFCWMRFIASVNLEATYPMVSDDDEEDVVIYFMIFGQTFSIRWCFGHKWRWNWQLLFFKYSQLKWNIQDIFNRYFLNICIWISNIWANKMMFGHKWRRNWQLLLSFVLRLPLLIPGEGGGGGTSDLLLGEGGS